jgi:CheY-like chemotaxis protein
MMGGRIWAQSESGIGSIFHFTIQAQALEEKDFMPDDLLLRGRSVLVVAGNEALREMIAKMLVSWGMKVGAASSYEEAYLARKADHYDFAVVDVFLPDREGQSLVRSLLEMGLDPAGEDQLVQNPVGQDRSAQEPVEQNQVNRDHAFDKMFIIMLIPIGYNALREPKISAWITKPVKPHLLYGAIHDLLTSPNAPGPEQHSDHLRPSRKAEMKSLRILLAEDNQVNQKVALSMLKVLGYRADVSISGLEVLQALETQPYDVILMDIQMPEMDGLETTRRVRSMSGKQPFIIAMTAYAMEGDRELCLEAGMDEYIRKPIKIEELQVVLAAVDERLGNSCK